MDLIGRLRQHAQIHPETLAMVSPRYRDLTYRKLWNRVERATARLQHEWQVDAGDVVAYHGQAHPDALVLYLALARSAACLLPLEHAYLQQETALLRREFNVKTIVYAEGSMPDNLSRSHSLTELISVRCPHQPHRISEETSRPSLILLAPTSGQGFIGQALSLEDMLQCRASCKDGEVEMRLFDRAVLTQIALPVLHAGGTLTFT